MTTDTTDPAWCLWWVKEAKKLQKKSRAAWRMFGDPVPGMENRKVQLKAIEGSQKLKEHWRLLDD